MPNGVSSSSSAAFQDPRALSDRGRFLFRYDPLGCRQSDLSSAAQGVWIHNRRDESSNRHDDEDGNNERSVW